MRFVGGVDLMSTERGDVLEVLGERGRGDPGAESERELDGEGTDASGCAEHQDVVLRSDATVVHESLLGGQSGEREGGGLRRG